MSASSSFTLTRFRIIRPIKSSRQMTSSCPKYRIRHGLLTKRALGIRAVRREVKVCGRGGRGRVAEDQGSRGPGTKMKWDVWRRGRETRRSVSALKPSRGVSSLRKSQPSQLTGVSLQSAFSFPATLREVAAQHERHRPELSSAGIPLKHPPQSW
jgi:hypothetical protein